MLDPTWRQSRAMDDWPNELLDGLGYRFTSADVLAKERGDLTESVLRRRLGAAVRRLNERLDELEVERAIRPLTGVPAATLMEANELVHGALLGKVRLIDFDEPDNNEFTFTRHWQTRGSYKTISLDVVVFVNGIPLVVVERAVPSLGESVETAIERLLRHQGMDARLGYFGAPRLFHAAQVLVATCGDEAKYGTVGTPRHFFSEWKPPERATPSEPTRLPGAPSRAAPATSTPADEALGGLLQKRTLLELVRDFTVFQTGAGGREKKLARHAQVALVSRVMDRVGAARQPAARGGIVHHAHGSGKSLSMVFLAAKLQRLIARTGGALVVVSDRQDLRDQLAAALVGAGYAPPLETDDPATIRDFVSTAKGQTAVASVAHFQRAVCGRRPFTTRGDHLHVIVDEAFRSDERRLTANMRSALPNACFLGFTGTPLEKTERGTFAAFGSCIHKYTTEQAVADGAIVPVFYEKRRPLVDMKREALLRLFARLFRPRRGTGDEVDVGLPPSGAAPGAPSRIDLVCVDLVDHFATNVRPNGFKAQVVVRNRRAAVETKETLDTLGVFESAVVISGLPSDTTRLRKWHTTKEERRALLARFRDPLDPLAILVVCDQLLTDFDASVEQVLYVDAPLRGRWLQATARVNRIAEGKAHGLIVDYSTNARHVERALRAGNHSPPSDRASAPPSPHREIEATTIVAQTDSRTAGGRAGARVEEGG